MKERRKGNALARKALAVSVIGTMLAASPAWAETDWHTVYGNEDTAGASAAGQVNGSTTNGGSTGVSTTASNTIRTSFADVSNSYWAYRYITKLALRGVIDGYDGGVYRPDNQVHQEEVIAMVIRELGLEAEAKSANSDSYVLGFAVSDWAKPYIVEAINKGLINMQEESAAVADGAWGTRNATREWVAKVVVRAIGKADEAAQSASALTQFADDASISAQTRGYINTAVKYGIVDGFEDGTFKPVDPVNRAQMATFLSRSEAVVPDHSERSAYGYVTAASGSSIKIMDDKGVTTEYSIGSDTVVYNSKNGGTRITPADLRAENQVYVIQSGGMAYYIEVTKESAPVETVQGTVESVDTAALKITLNVNSESKTYDIVDGATVVDANGAGLSLRDIQFGSTVELRRTVLGADSKFSQITVRQMAVNKTADGTVVSVSAADKTITVNETGTGEVTYPIADNVTLTSSGKALADLGQIHPKDAIKYEVKANAVASIEVTVPYIEPVDQGTLVTLATDSATPLLTLKHDDGKFATYSLLNTAEVVISGMDYPTLNDLQVGDDIKVRYDNNNAVERIEVLSRSIQKTHLLTVSSYDSARKYLTLDNNGIPVVYKLTDRTEIVDKNGNTVPLGSFASDFPIGTKVDLTVSGDTTVLKIAYSYSYEGTIKQLNVNTGEFTLQTAEGQDLFLKFSSKPSIQLVNNATAAVSDLKTGDSVVVTFGPFQDVIADVKAKRTLLLRTVALNTTARQLTLRDDTGSNVWYTIPVEASIKDSSGTVLNLSSVPIDEPIQLAFLGSNVVSVLVPAAVRGQVTAVNATTGSISLLENGVAQTISVGSAPLRVKSGTSVSTSLTALKTNDRVEVVPDGQGGYLINVAQAMNRTVASYDTFNKILHLTQVLIQDQTDFEFHPKVYVHQGTNAYNPNFLMAQDKVAIYLIDGKIIELEKLP